MSEACVMQFSDTIFISKYSLGALPLYRTVKTESPNA